MELCALFVHSFSLFVCVVGRGVELFALFVRISSVFYVWLVVGWICVHYLYIFVLYLTFGGCRSGTVTIICTYFICILLVVGRGVDLCAL